jgi:hypothetical protein
VDLKLSVWTYLVIREGHVSSHIEPILEEIAVYLSSQLGADVRQMSRDELTAKVGGATADTPDSTPVRSRRKSTVETETKEE